LCYAPGEIGLAGTRAGEDTRGTPSAATRCQNSRTELFVKVLNRFVGSKIGIAIDQSALQAELLYRPFLVSSRRRWKPSTLMPSRDIRARMPPSPSLSARITIAIYLSDVAIRRSPRFRRHCRRCGAATHSTAVFQCAERPGVAIIVLDRPAHGRSGRRART
jgi:hypothetical protein